MSVCAPDLPTFKYFPFYIALDGFTGYLCGKLSQVNPKLTTAIFVIRSLAHSLFYQLANFILKGKDLQSQKIFLVTSTVVNMTFLITLRELNLIGRLFSCLLGILMIGHMIGRVKYIQDQERRIIEDHLMLDGSADSTL